MEVYDKQSVVSPLREWRRKVKLQRYLSPSIATQHSSAAGNLGGSSSVFLPSRSEQQWRGWRACAIDGGATDNGDQRPRAVAERCKVAECLGGAPLSVRQLQRWSLAVRPSPLRCEGSSNGAGLLLPVGSYGDDE
nr:hypothetical protein Iba_chr12aCG10990 [Ipomoea batatas]